MTLSRPVSVLVLGNGGREHAVCWKIAQSPFCKALYCAPGNGGTDLMTNVQNADVDIFDFAQVELFCREHGIDLVVVGPEAPLEQGIVDALKQKGIRTFGPTKTSARYESSKAYAKQFLAAQEIPTARFSICDSLHEAKQIIKQNSWARVVKLDGLAAGKGVFVCDSEIDTLHAARKVAGKKLVIEERLYGEELSLLTLCDGKTLVPLLASQDHKRRFDGDKGPNTGGMGAYSPVRLYEQHKESIERKVLQPLRKALENGDMTFQGVLFIGLMICKQTPHVLEFNVRFGDPETQTILPLMTSDLLVALWACTECTLHDVPITWSKEASCCVCLVANTYPESGSKGENLKIDELPKGAKVFHAGTRLQKNELKTNGGRILNVVGVAPSMKQAIAKAYLGVASIHAQGLDYRKDIAARVEAP